MNQQSVFEPSAYKFPPFPRKRESRARIPARGAASFD
jgi:hypothetical protein